MNTNASASVSPVFMVRSIWRNRDLILRMTRRNLALRYKGSMLGLFWSFLSPLLMLAVYAFMFLYVFQAKWGAASPDHGNIAYVPLLFTGLVVHAFLAEVIVGSPGLILANVNFVKKVVFPLEILAVITVAGAFVNALAAALILLCMQTFLGGQLHLTSILFPFILLPLAFIGLGICWFMSALGVFVRDIVQIAGLVTTAALFLSPIFFPVEALPEKIQVWMMLNPLTLIVEQARAVIVYGQLPDIFALTLYTFVAAAFASIGFMVFQKLSKGFADVL